MAVSLRSLAPNTKINLVTRMQIQGRTTFNGYTFQGEVPMAVASMVTGDLRALVAQTKAYFRSGSSYDEAKINYILLKQSESTPVFAIPEPLIELTSVQVAGATVYDVVVRDGITEQELQNILSGNGLTDFSVTARQV